MSENKDPVRELIMKHCREKVHKFLTVPTLYEQLAGLGSEVNMKKLGVCSNKNCCPDVPRECAVENDCFRPEKTGVSMRKFETGATRDTDEGKPDYAGYESFRVKKRFGQYMLEHQKQADGSMRGSDNWKLGLPMKTYRESGYRHTVDFMEKLETGDWTEKEIEDLLCAIIFNWQGFLHEFLVAKELRKRGIKIYPYIPGMVMPIQRFIREGSPHEQNTGRHIEDEKLMED